MKKKKNKKICDRNEKIKDCIELYENLYIFIIDLLSCFNGHRRKIKIKDSS